MARTSGTSEQIDRSQFPIFSHEEYDFRSSDLGWPIGLKSTFPEELIRRIAAAQISYQAGLRSIDYTYKRYLKDHTYKVDDGSRLDLRIGDAIRNEMNLFSELIHRITQLEPKKEGQIIAEWTFLRAPFCIEFILSCANRGAFFETAAIARMLLEQIAWATRIDQYEDHESIRKTSATRAIGRLTEICPAAGRLYGWLSAHAHWAYEGHIKAMSFERGRLGTLFATSAFKVKALALTILMSIISVRSFIVLKEKDIDLVLALPDRQINCSYPNDGDVDEYEHHPPVRSSELRRIKNSTELANLMSELVSYDSSDSDVKSLTEMARLVCK